jgi:hypothetical protein
MFKNLTVEKLHNAYKLSGNSISIPNFTTEQDTT